MRKNLNEYRSIINESNTKKDALDIYEELLCKPELILNNFESLNFNQLKASIIKNSLEDDGVVDTIESITTILDKKFNSNIEDEMRKRMMELGKVFSSKLNNDFGIKTVDGVAESDSIIIKFENLKVDLKNKEYEIVTRERIPENILKRIWHFLKEFSIQEEKYDDLYKEVKILINDYISYSKSTDFMKVSMRARQYNRVKERSGMELKFLLDLRKFSETKGFIRAISLAVSEISCNLSILNYNVEERLKLFSDKKCIPSILTNIFFKKEIEKLNDLSNRIKEFQEVNRVMYKELTELEIKVNSLNNRNFENRESVLKYYDFSCLLDSVGYKLKGKYDMKYIKSNLEDFDFSLFI